MAGAPYCNLALRALNAIVPSLAAHGATLVAVAPERTEAQQDIADKHALDFPLLHDADSRVARLFGLAFVLPENLATLYRSLGIDLAKANASAPATLPLPATYVIARDGTVAEAFIDIDYTRRAEPADIQAAVVRLSSRRVR